MSKACEGLWCCICMSNICFQASSDECDMSDFVLLGRGLFCFKQLFVFF